MGETAGLLMAMQGVNAAASAGSAYTQSQALLAQGKAEQQFANYNASQATEAAQDAMARGGLEANQATGRGERIASAQRANAAGNNLDPNYGTPAAAQDEAIAMGEADALTARNNAVREAYGLKKDASAIRYRGDMARMTSMGMARDTIATGGLQVAQDTMRGLYLYETYKGGSPTPPRGSGADLYVRQPGGKTMSDPRNR